MLTIVHGDDEVASRKYFNDQKNTDSLTFDAENLQIQELEQSLSGSSLFGSSQKIFIDNLFTRQGIKNLELVAETLASHMESGKVDVYVWTDKILSTKQLSSFPKAEVKLFKIPQNIWAFVDGIRPSNKSNVTLFHKVLSETQPEIIFAMIIRQFRLMIGLQSDNGGSIDEVKRLAPWQRSKLLRQASLFGLDKLKEVYKKLYKIDKSQKTGKSGLSLTQDIDMLLLSI